MRRQQLRWPGQPLAGPPAPSDPGVATLFVPSRALCDAKGRLLRVGERERSAALRKATTAPKDNHLPGFLVEYILFCVINLWLPSISELGERSCSAAHPAASCVRARRVQPFSPLSCLRCTQTQRDSVAVWGCCLNLPRHFNDLPSMKTKARSFYRFSNSSRFQSKTYAVLSASESLS